jgi:formyl-CoA transferase/CoA:oxalate CoA-transferase
VTGEGQFIDVSLLESQMIWLENYAGEYFATGDEPPRRGSSHPQVVPYEPVQGSDDVWFILGVGSDNLWHKFCDLTGLESLRDDPRFYTNFERVRNREALMPHVREVMVTRPAEEWISLLQDAGIPAGPIRPVSQALADPQVIERNFIVELEHPALGPVKSLATPIHMSRTAVSFRRHPPLLGEHTEEVLGELGYNASEIQNFRDNSIV